jgi:outer membrane biogenesis lipoprotein LolB
MLPRRLLPVSTLAALALLTGCGADAGTPAGDPPADMEATPGDQVDQMTPFGEEGAETAPAG